MTLYGMSAFLLACMLTVATVSPPAIIYFALHPDIDRRSRFCAWVMGPVLLLFFYGLGYWLLREMKIL